MKLGPVVVGIVIGALGASLFFLREHAYGSGQLSVIGAVCPQVVEAMLRQQQAEAKPKK